MKDPGNNFQFLSPVVDKRKVGIPPEVSAFEKSLFSARDGTEKFKKLADGYILGVFGLDGALTFIPVVGGLFSVGGGFRLMSLAAKARCGFKVYVFGFLLILCDVIISIIPGPGDIVDIIFRSHAFFANLIMNEIDRKVDLIGTFRNHAQQNDGLEPAELQSLRDHLYRGGATENATLIRMGAMAVVLAVLLYGCVSSYQERQKNIRACEDRGGWFCSYRY